MRRTMRWAGALAMATVAPPIHAQDGRPAIAVLAFENGGSYGQDKETFEALEVGLPALLAASLAGHPGARLVDVGAVRDALARQHIGVDQRIDAASATRVAKDADARYVVTGSFADFYGKFRINARVVDARSGEIVKVVSNEDPKLQDRAQLGAILQLVTERVVAAVGLPPMPAEAAARYRSVPTEALTQFSRGLMFEARGNAAKAAEAYRRALTASPDYAEARDGLARVRGA